MATITCNISACTACFGYLYNWYAVDDSRNISSNDQWVIPTSTQFNDLVTYVGGVSVAGGKLKEVGLTRWDSPNTGATDEFGFSLIGAGARTGAGAFASLLQNIHIWGESFNIGTAWFLFAEYNLASTTVNVTSKDTGYSVRFVKDATGLADGITTTYTGNDGKIYNAIVVNELFWTTENLEETKFRNNDLITYVSDNTDWSNLTTEGVCLYDNDVSYACKSPVIIVI